MKTQAYTINIYENFLKIKKKLILFEIILDHQLKDL